MPIIGVVVVVIAVAMEGLVVVISPAVVYGVDLIALLQQAL